MGKKFKGKIDLLNLYKNIFIEHLKKIGIDYITRDHIKDNKALSELCKVYGKMKLHNKTTSYFEELLKQCAFKQLKKPNFRNDDDLNYQANNIFKSLMYLTLKKIKYKYKQKPHLFYFTSDAQHNFFIHHLRSSNIKDISSDIYKDLVKNKKTYKPHYETSFDDNLRELPEISTVGKIKYKIQYTLLDKYQKLKSDRIRLTCIYSVLAISQTLYVYAFIFKSENFLNHAQEYAAFALCMNAFFCIEEILVKYSQNQLKNIRGEEVIKANLSLLIGQIPVLGPFFILNLTPVLKEFIKNHKEFNEPKDYATVINNRLYDLPFYYDLNKMRISVFKYPALKNLVQSYANQHRCPDEEFVDELKIIFKKTLYVCQNSKYIFEDNEIELNQTKINHIKFLQGENNITSTMRR